MCGGIGIHGLIVEPASGAILVAGSSPWFGEVVWRSDDLGETWTHSSAGLTYGDHGPSMRAVWSLAATDSTAFAGVEPAGLFRSADGGASHGWRRTESRDRRPTAPSPSASTRRYR